MILSLLALAATCAELPAAVRDAPPGETVVLTTDCPAGAPLVINGRKQPVTIDATGRTLAGGLWLLVSDNVTVRGGIIEAPKGRNGTGGREGYAVTVEGGGGTLEGVTIRNAYRGLVTIRPRAPVHVRNSLFTDIRSDGINFATDASTPPVTGEIVGNRFEAFSPERSICLKDGVQIGPRPINRDVCRSMGGEWRDGDHPDCIQLWGKLSDLRIEGNRINTPAPDTCQGITMFGQALEPYQRVSISFNEIRTDDANGIAVHSCIDCKVVGNRLYGSLAYIRIDRPETLINTPVCGNSVARVRPGHIAEANWGTRPCPAR